MAEKGHGGVLLVREEQGVVTGLSGGPNMLDTCSILAANDPLHPVMLKLLTQEK